jgi:hypothetical protein
LRQVNWYHNTEQHYALGGRHGNFEFGANAAEITFFGNFRRQAPGTGLLAANPHRFGHTFLFAVSACVSFSGPVYVEVSGRAVDNTTVGQGGTRHQIYEVVPRIKVEAVTNNVGIGFQTIPVSSVTVTELVNRGLGRQADIFNLSVVEFGRPTPLFRFNPITLANVETTGMKVVLFQNQGDHHAL